NSIPELRNFIAREIKFPVDAQDELNDQLNMRFYVRVNNKGEITDIGENIGGDGEIFPVDEIVVTALRPKNVVKEKDIKNGNLMAKEAERVLNKLPDIEIPEAKGKILEFWFKFVLQE
ncbi:MAG: hypothetical protein JXR61_01385, partial [Prolixibacteraceae bacterium]|nr:hypothetical protein [Prolixibacteraceae bacterium]